MLVLMVLMLTLMVAGVVSRFLPQVRIARLDLLLPNLLVWLSMLGAVSAARRSAHLGMSALVERLPRAGFRAATVLALACGVVFFTVVGWQGALTVVGQVERGATAAFGGPAWLVSAAIPVGSALALVRILQSGVRWWRAVGVEEAGGT